LTKGQEDAVPTQAVEQCQFVTLNGIGTPVLSRWCYLSADPYAVTLSFRTDGGQWITWSFARDLIEFGLNEPTGLGDVRVRPDLSPDPDVLVIELESPDGYAVVEMKRADIERFLDGAERIVPFGAEEEFVDMDAFIEGITKV
jgi:Streptomyces sporulation and cell division protein, SsgA